MPTSPEKHRKYMHDRYHSDAEFRKRHLAAVASCNKRRGKAARALIREKKSVPCTDCGGQFPPCAMEFDHVRGRKRLAVSDMHARHSLKSILKEIEKCEPVCSNCHRMRTCKRAGRSCVHLR